MRFTTVTEIAGDEVTQEQLHRVYHRYYWAGRFCQGRDVLEVACGTGQGLGLLQGKSRKLAAGDISPQLLRVAQSHYGARVALCLLDGQCLPFGDKSLDVVILFEAIYYLPDVKQFITECQRVLRPAGCVLIATANKDLFDFNPSPFSQRYFGVQELGTLFRNQRFETEFFGVTPVSQVSLRETMLRPAKKIAVALHLIPKSMAGKKFLKRLVFGKLVRLPPEIEKNWEGYDEPASLQPGQPDRMHKVIYCQAVLQG